MARCPWCDASNWAASGQFWCTPRCTRQIGRIGENECWCGGPVDKGQPSGRDSETPGWIQHFAFRVKDKETLLNAKADLEAKGISVVGPTNHDDFLLSIYFFDPSGHRLELSVHTATPEMDQVFKDEAEKVLDLWSKTHDWSQRHTLWGSAHKYERASQ